MAANRDSLLPDLIDAIVTASRAALPGEVNVEDGFTASNAGGDSLWVGVEDPFRADLSPSAHTSQEWAGSQRQTGRNESGNLTCCIEAWTGTNEIRDARQRCFEILAPVAAWLRAADNAAVPGLLHAAVVSVGLDQALTDQGAVARLVFQIHYEGRI